MPATVVSAWPTPIVSTMTTSKPAASQRSMVSRVLAATPPSVPEEGEGRTKAAGSAESRFMRVLSPRIEPPLRTDEGSTASTATLWPRAVRLEPSASISVDLPAPGTPLRPIRIVEAGVGDSRSSTAAASRRWSARVDSTSVIARLSAARRPLRISLANVSASGASAMPLP